MSKKLSKEDYARAEELLPWNTAERILNAEVKPQWIGDTEMFWYRRQTGEGAEFVRVDAESGECRPAFDHEKLAAALSSETGNPVEPSQLPFTDIEFGEDDGGVRFALGEALYLYDDRDGALQKLPDAKQIIGERQRLFAMLSRGLISPDGSRAVSVKEANLVLTESARSVERPLTEDGEPHYAYGKSPDSNTYSLTVRLAGIQLPPMALWSPDSRKLFTTRLDERRVKELHLLQSAPPDGGARPVLHSYRYAMPGDEELPLAELMVFDVETGDCVRAQCPPLLAPLVSPVELQLTAWSEDSTRVYFVALQRGDHGCRLCELDAASGVVREILEEKSDTYLELNPATWTRPNLRVLDTSDELIWFSERDGWGHLYLHDLRTGELKNQITSGEWQVRDIIRVDEAARRVFFTACGHEAGRDPYYRHLYRVNLDGSDLVLLTPEDADHQVAALPPDDLIGMAQMLLLGGGVPASGFSTSARFFVDTHSRADSAAVSVLRSAEGELVCTLETADVSALLERGWRWPEPFSVKARDGQTDLYGLMYRPSSFDPEGRYPVIDMIYPGPQSIRTPKVSFPPDPGASFGYTMPQTLAELGFVVVTLDGMGTPFRSKAFHDVSYGRLDEGGGLEDHIAGLRQLAERHPYMDLERVGITGHSGGGYASTRAILAYPDFYKVAVSSAGNHDQRGYVSYWGEKYLGVPTQEDAGGEGYAAQINARLAGNLKGKLLLIAGDMDDNVHPALTMQVVDALIAANRDFDLLVVPNRNHRTSLLDPYVLRRLWDHFVRHLLGAEPPEGYRIRGPDL